MILDGLAPIYSSLSSVGSSAEQRRHDESPTGIVLNQSGGESISYFAVRPARALSEMIVSYNQTEAEVVEGSAPYLDMRTLFLPADCVRVLFCYNDTSICFRDERTSSQTRGNIIGMHDLRTPCYADHISRSIKIFEVRFKPGEFCRLFGVSPLEIGNSCLSADEVLGNEGRLIEDRLNSSTSLENRINILESIFIEKLKTSHSGTYTHRRKKEGNSNSNALHLIREHKGRIKMSQVARMLNISQRTMEWQLSHHIGLSAKEYARIVRFKGLMNDIPARGRVNWAELAISHGYHDQTHMIKEFKAATTLTPGSFMKLRGKAFFKTAGILNFMDPARNQPEFVNQWMEASVKMEEYLKSFDLLRSDA